MMRLRSEPIAKRVASLESFEYAISKATTNQRIEETFDIGEFPELIRHPWHRFSVSILTSIPKSLTNPPVTDNIATTLAHGKLKDPGNGRNRWSTFR